MEQQFSKLNGVTLKPGVRVLCTDRDHRNWDYEGTIVAVEPRGRGEVFDVDFGNGSTFKLDYDQIEPTFPNTPEATAEAELWKAARQLRVFLCHGATYIIPVKLDDAPVPKRLAKWQWISLVESGGRERLVSRLRMPALEPLSKDSPRK